ncbi:MAG: hypothetical protein RLZZ165_1297 [Bacteroidota bacterium]|jgi:uncharacterized membrane protein
MMPLHPSIVHFPPVLLLSAAVLYLLAVIRREHWVEVAGFAFHVSGLVFCILTIFSGDYEASRIVTNDAIRAIMGRHENLVMMATYGFGMLAVWAFLRQKSGFFWERITFLGVFLSLIGVLWVGAHLGGRLVYEHGGGVVPMKEVIQAKEQKSIDDSGKPFK